MQVAPIWVYLNDHETLIHSLHAGHSTSLRTDPGYGGRTLSCLGVVVVVVEY